MVEGNKSIIYDGLKKNPPSLAITATRPRVSKTHTSLGTGTPVDKSQATFDSLSLQGGPITRTKKKRLQKALNGVLRDVAKCVKSS